MPIEGLTAVQQRIAAIEAKIGTFRAPPVSQPAVGVGPGMQQLARDVGQFSSAYQRAVDGLSDPTATSTTTATSATDATASTTGPNGVAIPPELAPFGNGHIPPEMLVAIGIGDNRLWAPAARSFVQMRADAAKAGIDIGVTDTYRTYDQQVALAQQKGLYRDGGWVADPGTSMHGWGMAVDVDANATAMQWMQDNASRYGWVQDVTREPWHWDFKGA